MNAGRLVTLIAVLAGSGAVVALIALSGGRVAERPVTVASKSFTESVVLGEIAAHLARAEGAPARHRRQLGGTRLVFNALAAGEIDIYAEYTGTMTQEIFAGEGASSPEEISAALESRGLRSTAPLGFNNTYAIGMRPELAASLGIERISDLRDHPDLRLGFTNEFLDRGDGWPSLRRAYALTHGNVRGLDHDLAYRALDAGSIDAMDLYATDAEIAYYGLRVLEDDLGHFPRYDAVFLYRADLEERFPAVVRAMHALAGSIDENTMIGMNELAKLGREDAGGTRRRVAEEQVAADFLRDRFGIESEVLTRGLAARVAGRTLEHLAMVAVSLGAAIVIAVPLGVVAARFRVFGQGVLGVVGVVQTVPALAILVFMLPLFALIAPGHAVGNPPAIAALFLYSLLPIVRGTHAGLVGIDGPTRESADALGLGPWAKLRLVELPIASRSIFSGVKVAAVINIGTATLGGFIGAGGYGQPIFAGIRLDSTPLILEGAIPAAAMAVLAHAAFDGIERLVVPKGLRLAPAA